MKKTILLLFSVAFMLLSFKPDNANKKVEKRLSAIEADYKKSGDKDAAKAGFSLLVAKYGAEKVKQVMIKMKPTCVQTCQNNWTLCSNPPAQPPYPNPPTAPKPQELCDAEFYVCWLGCAGIIIPL